MSTAPVTDTSFNPSGSKDIDALKHAAIDFEQAIRRHAPQGRRQSLALTHLETSIMFAVKAAAVGDT